jgi:gluconolactonase
MLLRTPLLAAVLAVAAAAGAPPEQHPLPPTVAPGARLTEVYSDPRFFEGPVWDPAARKLLFTAFPKDPDTKQLGPHTQVMRLDGPGKAAVWMDDTGGVNGMYLARNGRLLAAQAFRHNLYSMRIGKNGPEDLKSLTNSFEGVTYNQPNDVCEAPNGGIYYSDPDFKNKTRSAVYYLPPGANAQPRRIITNLKVPNGVEVSNDGKTLVVGDSFEARIYSYSIQADGTVDQGAVQVFFDPATANRAAPDGMCTDAEGNFYFTMRGGCWVASSTGKNLGLIPVPEFCSNATFGGEDGRTLYLTADRKVYSIRMKVKGLGF